MAAARGLIGVYFKREACKKRIITIQVDMDREVEAWRLEEIALAMESSKPTDLADQSSCLWHTKRYGYSQINNPIQP